MLSFTPETIFVEHEAENCSLTEEILNLFAHLPIVFNANSELVLDQLRRKHTDVFGVAKQQLLLSRFKGSFLMSRR